jgi:hypothetical protein
MEAIKWLLILCSLQLRFNRAVGTNGRSYLQSAEMYDGSTGLDRTSVSQGQAEGQAELAQLQLKNEALQTGIDDCYAETSRLLEIIRDLRMQLQRRRSEVDASPRSDSNSMGDRKPDTRRFRPGPARRADRDASTNGGLVPRCLDAELQMLKDFGLESARLDKAHTVVDLLANGVAKAPLTSSHGVLSNGDSYATNAKCTWLNKHLPARRT